MATVDAKFGFKVVERSRTEIEPLVERAIQDARPIEVGLYFGDAAARTYLAESLPGAGLPIAAHLDHRRLSVLGAEKREPEFREQLGLAARLGASYVITHLGPHPMSARTDQRSAMLRKLLVGQRLLEKLCAEHGLQVHIENTYHGVAFYRAFFSAVRDAGLGRTNACFDMGHAKVWSNERLAEWLDFVSDLEGDGLALHFHMHANRGLKDDHLSFPTAERLGITGADSYTGGSDYYQVLAEIGERFPTSSKVFEVPAQEALENLAHVLTRIAERRPSGTPSKPG
jgi:sugar phosphate isomerase/epimerase